LYDSLLKSYAFIIRVEEQFDLALIYVGMGTDLLWAQVHNWYVEIG